MLYLNKLNLYNKQEWLVQQINALRLKIKACPDGELLCAKCRKYSKWYLSNGANPIYIPKAERSLAEGLALKKYYVLQLEVLERQLYHLTQYLHDCEKNEISPTSLLDENSLYKELLDPILHTVGQNALDWMHTNYPCNTNHPEYLIHKTMAGHLVRSKSEVIIANALYTNQIPYRYECALTLDEGIFYPDFTILHPKTEQHLYWEHFGMMDKTSYSDAAFNKLKLFASHGIIPTLNLITTYETVSHPIDSEKIQSLIQEYFL